MASHPEAGLGSHLFTLKMPPPPSREFEAPCMAWDIPGLYMGAPPLSPLPPLSFLHLPYSPRYMNSLYVAISVYAGLGDSSMYAQNTAEYVLMCIFCILNVFMAAYILGEP